MKKQDLAREIARRTSVSHGSAADQIDRMVHRILTNLRKGQTAAVPGLGTFKPGSGVTFHFTPDVEADKK